VTATEYDPANVGTAVNENVVELKVSGAGVVNNAAVVTVKSDHCASRVGSTVIVQSSAVPVRYGPAGVQARVDVAVGDGTIT